MTNDIVVSTPLILKASTTTIYGNGYAIDGNNVSKLMYHGSAGSSTYANLVAYDLTFRNAYSGTNNAYSTALNTNSLNFAGSKVKFEHNRAIGDYNSSVGTTAIGAAIYGGGSVELADSSFSNNEIGLTGEVKSKIENGWIDPTKVQEIHTEGAAIYAIGAPVRLLDTVFSNNKKPFYNWNFALNNWGATSGIAQDSGLVTWAPLYTTGVTGLGTGTTSGSVARPQISVSSGANPAEGSSGSGAVAFNLNAALPYPLEFNYTINGVSRTDVFPHSTSTYSPSVTIADDNLYNPGRTMSASVNTGNVYTIGTSSTTINITDDEPLVGFASSTASLTEGGSGTSLTLSLNKPAPRSFAIGYSVQRHSHQRRRL